MDMSYNMPPNGDIKHVAKTHFIIYARQFVQDFADYFDDVDAVQQVRLKFIAVFGDVPKDIDTDNHTELLYTFTPLGDKYVTKLLDNFGTLVRPYKSYINDRNPAVWHTLAQLKTEQEKAAEKAVKKAVKEEDGGGGGSKEDKDAPSTNSNLIKDLHIAELWSECDEETCNVIWGYVAQLLSYGTMYTTSTLIPESMMSALNKHTKKIMDEKAAAGQTLTKDDIQSSLSEIAPKILGSMKPEDIMNFTMKMAQNPHMMQDLMGMAKTVQSNANMPGFNAQNMLQNMFPGCMGMENMQQMLSSMTSDGQLPQINPNQFTQIQSVLSTMMGSNSGASPGID